MTDSLHRSSLLPAAMALALASWPMTRALADAKATADAKSEGSYSIGLIYGTQLRDQGLTPDSISIDQLVRGLRQGLSGAQRRSQEDSTHAATLATAGRAEVTRANMEAARKFLEANGKRSGVVTTPSGLQYRVLAAGDGNPPHAGDQVTVNYRGTLLDGSEFDSTYERGMPATFPLGGLIKGWQEAIPMMKPGAKWEVVIPPDLGYGANARPKILPGSLLKFEIELLAVKPAGAPPVPAAGSHDRAVAPPEGAH